MILKLYWLICPINEEETAMFLFRISNGEIGNCEYKRAKEGKNLY